MSKRIDDLIEENARQKRRLIELEEVARDERERGYLRQVEAAARKLSTLAAEVQAVKVVIDEKRAETKDLSDPVPVTVTLSAAAVQQFERLHDLFAVLDQKRQR